jgi:hypothetical protein
MDVGEFDFQRLGGAAEGEGECCGDGECSGEQSAFEVHGLRLQSCCFFYSKHSDAAEGIKAIH